AQFTPRCTSVGTRPRHATLGVRGRRSVLGDRRSGLCARVETQNLRRQLGVAPCIAPFLPLSDTRDRAGPRLRGARFEVRLYPSFPDRGARGATPFAPGYCTPVVRTLPCAQ